jgi:hypothetical protein
VAPAEYRFEHMSKITAADDDPTELKIEILDTSKSGFGYETVRFCCEARASLLTALLNRVDDMNGIGMWLWSCLVGADLLVHLERGFLSLSIDYANSLCYRD